MESLSRVLVVSVPDAGLAAASQVHHARNGPLHLLGCEMRRMRRSFLQTLQVL